MHTLLLYWPVAPIRHDLIDNAQRAPAFTIDVHADHETTYHLSLYIDAEGQPDFGRLMITGLPTEEVPAKAMPLIQSLREHLLSAIRLSHQSSTSFAAYQCLAFVADGKPPGIHLQVAEQVNNQYSPEQTKQVFNATFEIRELMRLYLDGCDERLPLQYRYLSFFKLLEASYRSHGHWEHKTVNELLQTYADAFKQLGFRGSPFSTLHDMRDRCAHIRTGKNVLGVTHLNLTEVAKAEKLLPYMRAIGARIINIRSAGKFVMNTNVQELGFAFNN